MLYTTRNDYKPRLTLTSVNNNSSAIHPPRTSIRTMLAFTWQCIHINRVVVFQTSSDLWRSSRRDVSQHDGFELVLKTQSFDKQAAWRSWGSVIQESGWGGGLILVTNLAWRDPSAITLQPQSSRPRLHWLQGSLMLCPQASSIPTAQLLMTQLR